MAEFKRPSTYLIGYSGIDMPGLEAYLRATDNTDFLRSIQEAREAGLSDGEIVCSFYAKLCYKSLTLGQNANVTRTRDIPDNLKATLSQGHGSVWEHVWLNFVTTDCSRVFTHELVRHRAGTAFSQTSGRYVRLDKIDVVWDPILAGCEGLAARHLRATEELVYRMECTLGLRVPPFGLSEDDVLEDACLGTDVDWLYHGGALFRHRDRLPVEVRAWLEGHTEDGDYWPRGIDTKRLAALLRWVPNDRMPFDRKKKLTSAIRRFAPNGQVNEIGWSVNLRALRHVIQLRTAPGAEWEIRLVFNQVFDLVRDRFPVLFHDAVVEEVDGLRAVSGMKTQPYA